MQNATGLLVSAPPPHAANRMTGLGVYGLAPKEMQDVGSGRVGRIGHGDNGGWLVDVSTGELTTVSAGDGPNL